MDIVTQKFNFWISSEFLAVGTFAFLGVAIRVGIENAFLDLSTVDDPSTGFGPFLQIFYTQNYLLPNFLGCFIMAVAIVNTAGISKISQPLFKGISTGLCGSITTFSSWINGAVCCLLGTKGSSSWLNILIMILLEFWLTWSAFTLGYAFAKIRLSDSLIYQRFVAPSPEIDIQEGINSGLVSNEDGAANAPVVDVASESRKSSARVNKRLSGSKRMSMSRASEVEADDDDVTFHAITSRISVWREDGTPVAEGDGRSSVNYGLSGAPNRPKSFSRKSGAFRESELATISEESGRSESRTVSGVTQQNTLANAASNNRISAPVPTIESMGTCEVLLGFFQDNEYAIWTGLFCVSAAMAWILTAFDPDIPFYKHSELRKTFLRSVALAPFGAWFRWGVTKFPELKASWPEMNPQTMLANISAVSIECILLVFAASYTWTYPINQGIMGSCSTVSTFFAEIHTLYYEKGAFVASRYMVGTFACAIICTQIIRALNIN